VIYLATATITPLLERTLTAALERTTDPRTYRLMVMRGAGGHGEKLDRAMAWLPADAEWFGTLDDDTAPLMGGWLPWLVRAITAQGTVWGGMGATLWGTPHPCCALYRVKWLRELGASFRPYTDVAGQYYDTGAGFVGYGHDTASPPPPPVLTAMVPPAQRPWWLRTVGDTVMAGPEGQIAVAHLGGGTIGSTNRRIPPWLWALLVRRAVDGAPARPPTRLIVDEPGPTRRVTVRQRVRAVIGRWR
jgi:hypothetical protein